MDTKFKIRLSAFSVLWLRAYDFGVEENLLRQSLMHLDQCPLVQNVCRVANTDEIDEIDKRMFDIRYQERSRLARVHFQPFRLVSQDLGMGRRHSASVAVNLLLDLVSGFGVFSLCMPQAHATGDNAFTVEEIGFLTRQWLLSHDEQGEPQRLTLQLPISAQEVNLFLREVMNFYFLQTYSAIWSAHESEENPALKSISSFEDWLTACREADPRGCDKIRELNQLELTKSLFPTSFGPIIDVWGIEGFEHANFNSYTFSGEYEAEIAWLFSDGQRITIGEKVVNQRNTQALALYVWPNHAIYINQNPDMQELTRVNRRVERFGCLDVEIVRMFEIINLQSALLHAFDGFLDQQLEAASELPASEQQAVIKLTEQRRKMSYSTRSFDFYNLFHTTDWEPLYVRLLENSHLRLREVMNLVDAKLTRLDEEIQQAIIIQDRTYQQEQRKQELDILRGLHNLSLANDIQSNSLLTINFGSPGLAGVAPTFSAMLAATD